MSEQTVDENFKVISLNCNSLVINQVKSGQDLYNKN